MRAIKGQSATLWKILSCSRKQDLQCPKIVIRSPFPSLFVVLIYASFSLGNFTIVIAIILRVVTKQFFSLFFVDRIKLPRYEHGRRRACHYGRLMSSQVKAFCHLLDGWKSKRRIMCWCWGWCCYFFACVHSLLTRYREIRFFIETGLSSLLFLVDVLCCYFLTPLPHLSSRSTENIALFT